MAAPSIVLSQEDVLYLWMLRLERLNDVLQDNNYNCASLATRIDYVDETLRLKPSVNSTICNRYVSGDSPFAEPVRLGFSVLLWDEFHGPIINQKHGALIKKVQGVKSRLILPDGTSMSG